MTDNLPPRAVAAERRREFRLLMGESSVDPSYDPYGVLDSPQETAVSRPDFTCETVGELIEANFLYLFDTGEHDTLRRLLIECAEWLKDMPLPPDEDGGGE